MTAVDVRPAARLAAGSRPPTAFTDAVLAALGTVPDPESDEPITGLGFVRSVAIQNRGVTVHLRLRAGFCAPDVAYLTVSDAYDALATVPGIGEVRIVLDGHRESVAPGIETEVTAGALGAFWPVVGKGGGAEPGAGLRRRAHIAAMERCCRMMLQRGTWTVEELPQLELFDLPEGSTKSALLRRRRSLGLPAEPNARVLVDEQGRPVAQADAAMRLRLSRPACPATEGDPHPCRQLAAARHGDRAGSTPRAS